MDNLAHQLRKDATDIHVDVSPELDYRIRASLEGITPEPPKKARPERSAAFWWASSLTGLAAAMIVITVMNLNAPTAGPQPVAEAPTVTEEAQEFELLPRLPLKAESAMIESPLEQEFKDIQSDIEKAKKELEDKVDLIL